MWVTRALCCPQGPCAQITDFLLESWKAYREECHRNMSRLPAPTGERCRGSSGMGTRDWGQHGAGAQALRR